MPIAGIKRYRNENNDKVAAKRGKPCSQGQSSSSQWGNLPKDLLHHILTFFFSEDSHVDENSIISAMLVSKHWNDVATSTALWQIPQRGSQHVVQNALGINSHAEFYCNAPSDEESFRPSSFLGFVKLESAKSYLDKNDTTVFRAMERSTRKPYVLRVSQPNQRSKEVLNHIFEQPPPLYVMGSNCQRIVLVYPDGPLADLEEDGSRDDQVVRQSRRARLQGQHRDVLSREPSTDRILTDHWAIIVDWVFEIATCFNIGVQVVFSGMELFRRFVDCYWDEMVSPVTQGVYRRVAYLSVLGLTKCICCLFSPSLCCRAISHPKRDINASPARPYCKSKGR